jgi:hypothetical protein
MASPPNPQEQTIQETIDNWSHRLSVEFFGEDPSQPQVNYHAASITNPQTNPQYYYPSSSTNPAQPSYPPPRHANLPLYPPHGPQPYISQDLNMPPQYPPPLRPLHTTHEIIEETPTVTPRLPSSVDESLPPSSQPSPIVDQPPAEQGTMRKRKKTAPKYEAEWWRFYEVQKDASGTILSGRCKVAGCKAFYEYKRTQGTSTFKKHVDKHILAKEEPQDRPDQRLVQTAINPDGTRTIAKYDEKRMLSEFARYIAQKEQPISMGSCMSFARLIVRGCGQTCFKRFHHRKVVGEIKKQYQERKNELLAIFDYANFKVSITSDIWTAGSHGLGYFCVTAHYIDDNWILQKRILSFRNMDYPHNAQVIYQSIVNILHEFNLKKDLENKIFSISFDNASNNIKSIDYFIRALKPIMNEKLFHQKCACHILNLTVQAGMHTPGVENLIIKFKDGLHHIYSNNVRKQ